MTDYFRDLVGEFILLIIFLFALALFLPTLGLSFKYFKGIDAYLGN